MIHPKVGLFIKTFKADLDWLYFGLQSIKRNWSYENTDILVVADPDCEPELTRWNFSQVRVVYTRPWPDQYCHAMAMKLCADIFLPEAELILLFDSDMMLTRPTSLSDLVVKRLPTIYYEPWDGDVDPATRAVAKQVWAPAVLRSTGQELDRDWMVSPLWLFWWSTFAGARQMIERHRRMPFLQAVYSDHPYDWKAFTSHPMSFCDMQTLGLHASQFEKHLYHFEQLTQETIPNLPLQQFWSHDPAPNKEPRD